MMHTPAEQAFLAAFKKMQSAPAPRIVGQQEAQDDAFLASVKALIKEVAGSK